MRIRMSASQRQERSCGLYWAGHCLLGFLVTTVSVAVPAAQAQELTTAGREPAATTQELAPAASKRDPGQLQSWRIVDRQMIDSYNLRSFLKR